jgi:plasmid maintenance system antidote protein VapI
MKKSVSASVKLMQNFLKLSGLSYSKAAEALGFSDSQKVCDVVHGRRGLTQPRILLIEKYLSELNDKGGSE